MMCQILLSRKEKEKYLKMLYAEFLPSMQSDRNQSTDITDG